MMTDLDVALLRLTLEGHAAHASGLLLSGGPDACDAYLVQVGYAALIDAYRAAGGLS